MRPQIDASGLVVSCKTWPVPSANLPAPAIGAAEPRHDEGMTDAPSARELTLWRLSAAAEESPQLQTLLRVCGATVQGVSAELLRNDWRDVEVAVAISEMLDQIKAQILEEVLS